MTELISGPDNDLQSLVIPSDRVPPAAWQAIYYHLTKKTETNRKLYTGAFEIDKAKIVDLITRINQSIVGYSPKAKKIEFSIEFRNDTSEYLSSVEKFSALDVSHKSAPTKNVTIDFDFILCPATEVATKNNPPQKFKLFFLLDQDFFLDTDPDSAGFFPDGVAGKNVLSIVEYSDYAVARTLRAVVDEWVATLPRRDAHGSLKIIPRIIKALRGSIPLVGGALSLIPFFRFSNFEQVPDVGNYLILAMFVAVSATGLSKFFVSWVMDAIAKIQPNTFLLVTDGDYKRRDRLERHSKQRAAFFYIVFTVVILGFFVGVASSLFATYIGNYGSG